MKYLCKHKKMLIVIAFAAAYLSVLLFIPYLIKLPGTISYSASTQGQEVDSSVNDTEPKPAYSSVKEISDNGPYRILPCGEDVYVFSGKSCLYKIKTTMSQFTSRDAESVLEGLEINDKNVLFELVEYIES